jgi:PAS domain S-box-containing protein
MTASGEKLLIIDDDPLVRESIATYLSDSGFTMFEAPDGPTGLDMYRRYRVDMLLVDLRMPMMDGLEVLSTVTGDSPETPVVVVSGTGVIQDAIEALRRGAWDFITKPIQDMAVLEHVVRTALERARLLVENRRYQTHLESEIQKRTASLRNRTQALERTNRQLEAEIAKRLAAQKTLKRKVAEQSLLLDNIGTQIWYLSDHETYGAVNKARAQFLGKGKQSLERRSVREILSPSEAEICVIGNRAIFDGKQQFRSEEWAYDATGQKRLLSITKTPKLDVRGNVEFVVCSAEDITDLQETTEALRRNKERLSLALEASQYAIWDWNLVDNTAVFSSRYYTMLGYEPTERSDSLDQWKGLLHPEDKTGTLARLKDYLGGRSADYTAEFRMRTKAGGWCWILARGKIVERNGAGDPVRMIGTHADITHRKMEEAALRVSEASLRVENVRLRSTLKGSAHFGEIIGKSRVMQDVYDLILKAALSSAHVIIYGESGTGKELVAKTIHRLSDRNSGRFVAVNCGAIPENLMESEFFGHVKGAFTGATRDKHGYLMHAAGGTLFLDEVGELDLNMQVKLLRAIEDGGFTPVGSRQTLNPDFRIIAATNRDLKKQIREGRMREDFYFRIHVVPIQLPPLRNRREDIPLMIHHFLQTLGDGRNVITIPEKILKAMLDYDWPGNVRELQNAIQRYITLQEIDFIHNVPSADAPAPDVTASVLDQNDRILPLHQLVARLEKQYIRQLLEQHQWRRARVAELLGINRRTLFRKMKAYELE